MSGRYSFRATNRRLQPASVDAACSGKAVEITVAVEATSRLTQHHVTTEKRKQMRILFCNYEYPPLGGGGGVINKQIAEELAKQHTVDVVTSQGMDLPAVAVENGVTVYRVPVFFRNRQAAANMPSMLAYVFNGIRKGSQLISENAYDIINTHFVLPSGPVGAWLAARARIPNVLSVHGGDLYDPSKWLSPHRHFLFRYIVRRLLRKANAVVGQSSNTIQNVHDYYDRDIACECIPLGIPRRNNPSTGRRSHYNLAPDDILLVTVGRLVARKAVDQLITMVSKMGNDRVHLLVVGSGPQEETLRNAAQELGVASRIHLLGQVSEQEKFEVLQMADIYTSTSQHEGFGIVYLEAMASALPVVCYDFGGQTDFLKPGVNGYLVRLNDIAEFQRACQNLIDDPELRGRIGKQNVNDVERYYVDNCAQRYAGLYESVLQQYGADASTGDQPG